MHLSIFASHKLKCSIFHAVHVWESALFETTRKKKMVHCLKLWAICTQMGQHICMSVYECLQVHHHLQLFIKPGHHILFFSLVLLYYYIHFSVTNYLLIDAASTFIIVPGRKPHFNIFAAMVSKLWLQFMLFYIRAFIIIFVRCCHIFAMFLVNQFGEK